MMTAPPDDLDPLDDLIARPDATEPAIDRTGKLALEVRQLRADVAALAREMLAHGVGGGERLATVQRIARETE